MDSLWPVVYNPWTVKIQPSDHRLPSGQAVPRSLRPLETAWPLGSLWSSGCIFTVLGLYTTGLMLSIQLFRKYQYSLRVISGHPSYCIHRVTWYWYKPSPVLIPAYSWYRWLVCIVFFSTDPTANHQQASKITFSVIPSFFTLYRRVCIPWDQSWSKLVTSQPWLVFWHMIRLRLGVEQ